MARTRVRTSSLLALSTALALALLTGCGDSDSGTGTASGDGGHQHDGRPRVVVTTTWEGAFAKAAGAEDIEVIVPRSVHHAPDYDPKPSDLAAVAKADFVLYAPFEPYAEKIKEAAGSDAELVEVKLDNDPGRAGAEITRLGKLFGTEDRAAKGKAAIGTEYDRLGKELRALWPGGKAPTAVSQVFTTWATGLAGAKTVGTYGPEAVTPGQLAALSAEKPALVVDNAHMATGAVLPDSGARQVTIANYPGDDLDLLAVYRDAAAELRKALGTG